ncbi:hypothetical protein PUN28_004629 [Cardiocondyla obscurior]|uniref:Uncharacterized protein n=1 Tax=Cardiocondyla obscurior TaxID=286306 RepID=A0AAW2GGV1_9HYME
MSLENGFAGRRNYAEPEQVSARKRKSKKAKTLYEVDEMLLIDADKRAYLEDMESFIEGRIFSWNSTSLKIGLFS